MRIALLLVLVAFATSVLADHQGISVSFDRALGNEPVTGRLFLLLNDRTDIEPRLVAPFTGIYYFNATRDEMDYSPFFGIDVADWAPGENIVMGDEASGFPWKRLGDIPPGEYQAQVLVNRFEQVTPAHGKTLWLPMDVWDGRQFMLASGSYYSDVQTLTVTGDGNFFVHFNLTRMTPPNQLPEDDAHVKQFRIRSEKLSEFWGRDMYVGATVLLPKGYHDNPTARYPVYYHRGHFFERRPFRFPDSEPVPPAEDAGEAERAVYASARALWDGWFSDDLPRFLVVTLQHPTPFYDDSYATNSPLAGPYRDAIMEELIPEVERRFRAIGKPYARVQTGGSTGGWIAAYAQITEPDFFGGAWSYCPDWVDYREFLNTNMYEEDNAFVLDGGRWLTQEKPFSRTVQGRVRLTNRQFGQLVHALGGERGLSGEFTDAYAAHWGDMTETGYPRPAFDPETGQIDHEVVETWRRNGYDLREYLERKWPEIGPKLVGQLHFICGWMDNFYLNPAMYGVQAFLESTTEPHYGGSFRFGGGLTGHAFAVPDVGLMPYPFALIREMAAHIERNAPRE